MMSADEILKATRKTATSFGCQIRARHVGEDFDCKRAYGRGEKASDGFDTKEERERWGGRLSVAPRGFSGHESGTRSVVRSMNFDRMIEFRNFKAKVEEEENSLFHDFFKGHVFPYLVNRFNSDGKNEEYDWQKVPQPCLQTREGGWIVEFAKKRMWADEDGFKELVVTMLRFVVQHGDFKTDGIGQATKCIKSRLVEAYHWVIGDFHNAEADKWWKGMYDERKLKGEI